ncbi:zincin [Pleomassaria siparia CBS 279.74]|uniref:Zincin n=1 Tax=Pleomassaria siparia CBS 279.74 TaxID=1314801 RepID=A0A6G1K0A7_9PLEO|nr:zincin [Pleomassaria siparia CBS 279.74]
MRLLVPLLSLVAGCSAATFTSCTPDQVATLEVAIDRATNKSYAAIAHLQDNPTGSELQTTWYGTFDTARYDRILAAFKKFGPDLATKFEYDCSCQGDIVIAYPHNTYGLVTVCSVYFNTELVPATGHRSQWDTLVHEATHFRDVLGATDSGSGVDYCKSIALSDPVTAVKNAE